MQVIDAHCHASPYWYEPVESLLFQMDRYGVSGAALIQMMGEYDNSYLFECAQRFPGRFAPVVLVDSTSPAAVSELKRLHGLGASGVRFRVPSEAELNDALRLWQCAAQLGLSISCLGTTQEYASSMFLHCLETAAQTPVVIEHLGGLGKFNPDNPERECLVDHVLRFARYPHTYMKLTGLGELRQRAMPVNHAHPFVPTAGNLLDRVIAAFGPQRLMWGSDYPPVSAREGYGNALNWLRDQLTMLSKNTQQAIFAETAQRVFPLRS